MLISPRDYDPLTREVSVTGFEKVHANGLSAVRHAATDQDLLDLAADMMPHREVDKHKEVLAVCEALVSDIRAIVDADGERIYGVYDQTVPRRDGATGPHVPTHISVLARLPLRSDQGGQQTGPTQKELKKEYVAKIYDLFVARQFKAGEYRNGVFDALNVRARSGEFSINSTGTSQGT
jgi:hypothetical protein